MMCYLQLSLLHIPAEIVHGNALSLEVFRVMRTPAHHLGLWSFKLDRAAGEEITEPGEQDLNGNNDCVVPVKNTFDLVRQGDQISFNF